MLMPSLALGAPIRSPNALGAPIRSPNAHYEPPKFIMNTSFIMNLIMRFLVFQCTSQWCCSYGPCKRVATYALL